MGKEYRISSLNLIIACALFLGGTGFLSQSVADKEPSISPQQEVSSQGECFSLDVVFLIDQSDSMSGFGGTAANDPTEQRVAAVRWAIDWLSQNAASRCPDAFHRIAMISYGSNAQVDLPLQNINPANLEEAISQTNALEKNIRPLRLGQTNPKEAFALAKRLLDDAAPIGGGIRKQAIIFITDGHPCVGDCKTMDFVSYARETRLLVEHYFPFDETLLARENCLKDLQDRYGQEIPGEQINACFDQYRVSDNAYRNSTYIWALLLNFGEAYSNRLREEYVAMSESHAGTVFDLKENRRDIPEKFLAILTQLAGVQVQLLNCGDFAVNPFLSQAQLGFFKADPDTNVIISYQDVDGRTYTIDSTAAEGDQIEGFHLLDHGQGVNETFIFAFPEPGIWSFNSDLCQGISAYFQPIDIVEQHTPLEILPPNGTALPLDASYDFEKLNISKILTPPYYDSENPYYLQYTIRGSDVGIYSCKEEDGVIPPYNNPFFKVQVDASVTAPDGSNNHYQMEWNEDTCAYVSTTPLTVPMQGEYGVSVQGTVRYYEGSNYQVPSNQSLDSIFDAQRTLFKYTDQFNVFCPGIEHLSDCPWEIETLSDSCQICKPKAFQFQISTPEDNADLGPVHGTLLEGWPLPVNPIPFAVEFSSPSGFDFVLDDVLVDPEQPFEILLIAGGRIYPLTYQRDPENPLRFEGEITGVNVEGKYELSVKLVTGHSPFYSPVNEEDQRAFIRKDGLWNRTRSYYGLGIFSIALVVASMVYQVMIRTNKVRGELVFRAGEKSWSG